jgi:MFS family permease
MLPLRLFRNRGFGAAAATSFLTSAALISAAFLGAQFFQFVQGEGPFATGLSVLPWTGTPVFIAPLAGAVSDRIGRRPVMSVGLFLQGVGLLGLAAVSGVGVSYPTIIIPLVIAGVGVSMALPTTATSVISAVAPSDMGKAAGVSSTLQRFGAVFGIALVSAVFAANGHLGSPASYASGFAPAVATSGVLSLLGSVIALGVPGRAPRAAATVEPGQAIAS